MRTWAAWIGSPPVRAATFLFLVFSLVHALLGWKWLYFISATWMAVLGALLAVEALKRYRDFRRRQPRAAQK